MLKLRGEIRGPKQRCGQAHMGKYRAGGGRGRNRWEKPLIRILRDQLQQDKRNSETGLGFGGVKRKYPI